MDWEPAPSALRSKLPTLLLVVGGLFVVAALSVFALRQRLLGADYAR